MNEDRPTPENVHPTVAALTTEFLTPTGTVTGVGFRAVPETNPPQQQPTILLSPSASDYDEQDIMKRAVAITDKVTPRVTPAVVRCGRFGGLGLGAAMAPLDVKRCNIPPVSAGTYGATMKDAAGNVYVLSANHVLAHNGRTLTGTGVFTRGPEDDLHGGTRIAHYSRYVRLVPPPRFNQADCAWAKLPPGTPPPHPSVPPVNATSAALGMNVVKTGRTSGRREGTIHYTNLVVSLDYTFGTFYLENQVATFDPPGADPPFAEAGDSGALVLNAHDPSQGIGLVCARAYLYTGNQFAGYLVIICPLGPVITAIGGQGAHGLANAQVYAV